MSRMSLVEGVIFSRDDESRMTGVGLFLIFRNDWYDPSQARPHCTH